MSQSNITMSTARSESAEDNHVAVFQAFLEEHHRDDIARILLSEELSEQFSVVVNALELFDSSIEVSQKLLAEPNKMLPLFDSALSQAAVSIMQENATQVSMSFKSNMHVRLSNLPICPELRRDTIPKSSDIGRFLAVSETSELGFNVYGNRDIATLAQHFYQADNDASQKTTSSKLLAEWNQMKININENIKPNIPIEIKTGKSNTPSTQWYLSRLMKSKSEYQPYFGELPLIAEAAITLPVSNAWPERDASAYKIVQKPCRSCLQNDILEAMLHVKINGPALGSLKMESLVKQAAVETWLNKKKNRTKLPSRQHDLITTTEAPHPVHIPKEVADVSIQTVAVEDDVISIQAHYEVQHQVEEVSTLLDISTGLPDSNDYDCN